MNRRNVYDGEIPRTQDFLDPQTETMVSLGRLAVDALFGQLDPVNIAPATLASGFTPSYPGALTVNFAAGRLYAQQAVDATVFGDPGDADLSPDTRVVYKQFGSEITPLTFGAAPVTVGQARIDLVQAQFASTDTDLVQLLYWNSANSTEPYLGPNGDGTSQHLNRKSIVNLAIKAGAAGVSPVAPAPDAGWVPLFRYTIAHGVTVLSSTQYSVDPSAPFFAGLRTFSEPRKNYVGLYATTTARDTALPNPNDNDWIVILNDGDGNLTFQLYDADAVAWGNFGGTGSGGGGVNLTVQAAYTPAAGDTVITLTSPVSTTSIRSVLVVRGHLTQIQGIDWNLTDATHITFTKPCVAGEIVQVMEIQRTLSPVIPVDVAATPNTAVLRDASARAQIAAPAVAADIANKGYVDAPVDTTYVNLQTNFPAANYASGHIGIVNPGDGSMGDTSYIILKNAAGTKDWYPLTIG